MTNFIHPIDEKITIFGDFSFENPQGRSERYFITRNLHQILSNEQRKPTGLKFSEQSLINAFEKHKEFNPFLKFKSGFKDPLENLVANLVILTPNYEHTLWPSISEVKTEDDFELIKQDENKFIDCIKSIDFAVFSVFNNTLAPLQYDTIFLPDYFNPHNVFDESILISDLNSPILFPHLMNSKITHLDEYLGLGFPKFLLTVTPILNLFTEKKSNRAIGYARDSLYQLKDIENHNLILVLLISMLEFFVTHKPDQKFNQEDSITSQLKRNLSTLVYLENPSSDLNTVRKEISLLYSLRSDIAHGNFENLTKSMQNLMKFYHENDTTIKDNLSRYPKTYSNQDFIFSHSVNRTKYLLKVVLRRYFADEKFIEHIKL